jgi:hypothetical protein
MSTPIADMVAQLLAANMPHGAIVLAVAAVERAVAARGPSTGMSTVSTADMVDTREKKKLRECLKKRRYRAKLKAKRENSPPAAAARPVDESTVPVVDMVDMRAWACRWHGPATSAGWSTAQLFGLSPDAPQVRRDLMGGAFLACRPDCQTIAVDSKAITLVVRTSSRMRVYKPAAGGALAWDCKAGEHTGI